ncbi:MAG TPA: YetF domain-containing protein [Hyphomicrobiaceae bacterium]|nr:YetF domain-containing protein [Hyphomicrobiaceae bacterium]
MLTPSISIGELMLRAIVVYAFVLLLLRIIGKKHIGEMAPFDLVVLLILSESVQNALVADDKSLIGGLIVATTLFAANQLLGHATWRSKTLARLFEGTPRILVRNGRVCSDVLASEQVTAARGIAQRGCTSLVNVRYAVLKNDGNITVGLRARARYDQGEPARAS